MYTKLQVCARLCRDCLLISNHKLRFDVTAKLDPPVMENDYKVRGKSFVADKRDLGKSFSLLVGSRQGTERFEKTRTKYLNFKMEIIA